MRRGMGKYYPLAYDIPRFNRIDFVSIIGVLNKGIRLLIFSLQT